MYTKEYLKWLEYNCWEESLFELCYVIFVDLSGGLSFACLSSLLSVFP